MGLGLCCVLPFVALVAIGLMAGDPDEDQEEAETTTTAPVDETATITPAPSTTAGPAWVDGAPITEEAVIAQLADSPRKLYCADRLALSEPEAVEITGGDIRLTYHQDEAWDNDARICTASHTAYSSSRSLLLNPEVTSVRVDMTADLTDALGNERRDVILASTVSRALADEIGWDGLGDRLESDDEWWFCIAEAPVIVGAVAGDGGLASDSCWWSL